MGYWFDRFFVGYGLELSRIVPLIIYHLKRKYLCKNEAELREAWFPGDINYATRVPSDMLIVTIVLCYSVIAPVIIPFGVLYFSLGWLVLRNQVFFPVNFSAYYNYSHNLILVSFCSLVVYPSYNRHSKFMFQHMRAMEECGLTCKPESLVPCSYTKLPCWVTLG